MSDRVYVVSIEVDGRQAYVFETDRLREMLGASRLIQATVPIAEDLFKEEEGLFLFQPVSGEIRAWAEPAQKQLLLERTWALKTWLNDRGIEHSCGWSTAPRRDVCEWAQTEERDRERRELDDDRPSLAHLQRDIGARVSARKGSKGGIDARPTCSLFVPCEIHGHDFATEWRTGQAADQQDSRRNLRGARAAAKYKEWTLAKEVFFKAGLYDPAEQLIYAIERVTGRKPERPIRLDDLSSAQNTGDGDQFVAFICLDGDGLGDLLQHIDWNNPNLKHLGAAPWDVNRKFAKALDAVVNQAYAGALVSVLDDAFLREAATSDSPRLPLLPQLLGGDDLWTVSRREVALPFCCNFADAFAARVAAEPTIKDVVTSTGRDITDLTVSFGVAFAKAGYPAHAMIEAAGGLLHRAKDLRKGQIPGRPKPTEGCIDWHWIDSSLIQSVADARRSGWEYADAVEGVSCSLVSRPWTMTQCRGFVESAGLWARGNGGKLPKIPRRKREQLEPILRRGPRLALLGWESWLKSLAKEERDTLGEVFASLERAGALPSSAPDTAVHERDPWTPALSVQATNRQTPFLDLLSLDDVLGATGGGRS